MKIREEDSFLGKALPTAHREKLETLRSAPFSALVARSVPRNEFINNPLAMANRLVRSKDYESALGWYAKALDQKADEDTRALWMLSMYSLAGASG